MTVAGDWVIQTPLFIGMAAVQAFLPSEEGTNDIAIAVANTYGPGADVSVNGATGIMVELAKLLAPGSPLPPQIS